MATRRKRTRKIEKRSTLVNPIDAWLIDALGGGDITASKQVMNSRKAMWVPAWYAAIRCISEDIAKLPFCIYKKTAKSREEVFNHPALPMLNWEPNDEMTAISFWETLISHSLAWAGGYAEIIRDQAGRVTAMYPLDPTTVKPIRVNGALVYKIRVADKEYYLEPSDVFHLHGLSFDGIAGMDVANLAKEVLGNALSALQHSGAFFGHGCSIGGILKIPNTLDPKSLENLRQSFASRYAGGENAYKTAVLEQGVDFVKTAVDPEKSQMIQSLEWSVKDIARIFRIPPHKLGDLTKSAFSNIEQQSQDYINETLMGWSIRIVQEIRRKLISDPSLDVRHDFTELLRADAQTRATFNQIMFINGFKSQNEVRASEGLPNIGPDGDKYYRPANIVDISQEPEETEPETPGEKEPEKPGETEPETDNETKRKAIDSHKKLLASAIRRLLHVEKDKVLRYSKTNAGEIKLQEFYADHSKNRINEVSEVLESFKSCANLKFDTYTESFSIMQRHCDKSQAEFKDIDKVNNWLTYRPDEVANTEIERLINGK